ncbi:MAG: lipoprotein signal peptidase [Tenuifilaceae bacterium]|jgi:signal peptidase II|nr:lipoprotein signal peptidase [Tenuifilaceae bacterium]
MKLSLRAKVILLVSSILVVDQLSKFWIKLNMSLGQSFNVIGDWFLIHFTENYGMAFGLQFWGEYGKLALSIFRIVAVILIGFYIASLIKKKMPAGLVLGIALIMAGAIGNIIDSAFYGLIFSESGYATPATILPADGGYASFLHGRVVDMFYFPIINTTWPSWVPWVGGERFIFFRPVFNVADSAITIGVFYLLLFQRKRLFHDEVIEIDAEQ